LSAGPIPLLAVFLTVGVAGLSGCVVQERSPAGQVPRVAREGTPVLRFRPDGSFKIVQFTDTQDDHEIDPRTVRLMETVLDDEAPDLVVFTGDNIRAGPTTPEEAKHAMDAIVRPVEERKIPWLIAFGNHDEDQTPATGLDEEAMLAYYRSFPGNLNRAGPAEVHGTGNMYVVIEASAGDGPRFAIWALDSGRYSPEEFAGQSVAEDGLPGWDVIRQSQVAWYFSTSEELEARHGGKIPGLMFFHIPLREFHFMWENRQNHSVEGEKNEPVSSGPFNSGLFAAMLERGDVRGVFVGHDHVNDFTGDYFGIRLGYSANTGFGTYGLDGAERDRMRGARVFMLDEDDPWTFETFMVFARDYGI
jgi:3',5'-cyclic AMP phosphodiesterase CpdA